MKSGDVDAETVGTSCTGETHPRLFVLALATWVGLKSSGFTGENPVATGTCTINAVHKAIKNFMIQFVQHSIAHNL